MIANHEKEEEEEDFVESRKKKTTFGSILFLSAFLEERGEDFKRCINILIDS